MDGATLWSLKQTVSELQPRESITDHYFILYIFCNRLELEGNMF